MKKTVSTIGVSSLLVIFAVLCLTVFALLSVSTAQASVRLADSARAAAYAYYEGDFAAETILAQLRAGQMPQGVQQDGDRYYYTCPAGENQLLTVCVKISGAHYRILRWQTVAKDTWQPDEKLPVWDGK